MTKKYKKLPRFSVTDGGLIISNKTGKQIKTAVNKYGYERLSVVIGSRTDGSRKHLNLKVHRMIAETFLLNKKNLPTVNHLDGNKLNNNVENLEWSSFGDNNKHARKMGLVKSYKLTPEHRQKMKDGWYRWFHNGGKEKLIFNLIGQKNYLSK